jgi:hypothetical protein
MLVDPHRRERRQVLAQFAGTRELSNSSQFRHVPLRELDKSVLLQGVSLERMEIGMPAVMASQAVSMPRKEIAQLRDEASTVRENCK